MNRRRSSSGRPSVDDKVCSTCGRRFAFRKRLARSWAEVRYCSDRCRAGRRALGRLSGGGDEARPPGAANEPVLGDGAGLDPLERAILERLARRARGATICPSEVLPAGEAPDRPRMEAVRAAARRLVHRGLVEITQRGQVVDPDRARGPIRIRRR